MDNCNHHRILVVGSSNTDMVIKAKRFPRAGETLLGGTFLMNPGGKGANQAVAVARLGGKVSFICKTGSDIFGKQAQLLFKQEGIDTSYIFTDAEHPSGVALITVDERGENSIVVASGANACLSPADVASVADAIKQADIVLIQLEIPMETVEYVAGIAFREHKKLILNPAPAQALSQELLRHVYMITPNETEAEMISGIKITGLASAEEAAKVIAGFGVQKVIITLGAQGALVYSDTQKEAVPAWKVDAVDTTAAGDVFNGALAVALAEDRDLIEAVKFACRASAISVTRPGAQASVPFRREVDTFHT